MLSKRGLAFLLMAGVCLALTATLPNCIVGDVSKNIAATKDGTYNPYREFNTWANDLFFQIFQISFVSDLVYEKFGPDAGYYVLCYLRDFVLGSFVYWATAGIWHFVIYYILGNKLFTSKGRAFPTTETFIDQITLAQSSLVLYAALPILSEFMIENKMTQAYFFIDEVGGWAPYFVYLAIYITLVEIGVYWMHRTLHENKFLYKYVHGLHHKYNKHATLTPWTSLAFNPIDGMLQASPYVVFLFVVPVHYFTHIFLLFFSGVWATNIHDALWADTEPIMGSKYHTLHHTHYHYNYGQWFIFCDYLWGTLRAPEKQKFE